MNSLTSRHLRICCTWLKYSLDHLCKFTSAKYFVCMQTIDLLALEYNFLLAMRVMSHLSRSEQEWGNQRLQESLQAATADASLKLTTLLLIIFWDPHKWGWYYLQFFEKNLCFLFHFSINLPNQEALICPSIFSSDI